MNVIELTQTKVDAGDSVPLSFQWTKPMVLKDLNLRSRGIRNGEEVDAFEPVSLKIGKEVFDAEAIMKKAYAGKRVEPGLHSVELVLKNVSDLPAETYGEWIYEPAGALLKPKPMSAENAAGVDRSRSDVLKENLLRDRAANPYDLPPLNLPPVQTPQALQAQTRAGYEANLTGPVGYDPAVSAAPGNPYAPQAVESPFAAMERMLQPHQQPVMGHGHTTPGGGGAMTPAYQPPPSALAQPIHGSSQILGGPGYPWGARAPNGGNGHLPQAAAPPQAPSLPQPHVHVNGDAPTHPNGTTGYTAPGAYVPGAPSPYTPSAVPNPSAALSVHHPAFQGAPPAQQASLGIPGPGIERVARLAVDGFRLMTESEQPDAQALATNHALLVRASIDLARAAGVRI